MPKAKLAKMNFILLFCLLSLAWVQSFTPLQTVLASEADTIDSFDVHPANRWTADVSTGITVSVNNSLLNMSDVGDSSTDYVRYTRGLRVLAGKIEFRFKWDVNDSSAQGGDYFQLRLCDPDDSANNIRLQVRKPNDGSYCGDTYLAFEDTGGSERSVMMSGTDRIYDNLWYKCTFDYDLLESSFRARLYFENNTKVWDKYWYDISASYRPIIFEQTSIDVEFQFGCYDLGLYSELLLDYVKAPFKERDWVQVDTPTDPQYLADDYCLGYCEDDIDDTSKWRLVVPNLDSVAGSMTLWMDYPENLLVPNEYSYFYFRLYGVDADDGDLHEIFEIYLKMTNDTGDYMVSTFFFQANNSNVWAHSDSIDNTDNKIKCEFAIELTADRSSANIEFQYWLDSDFTTEFYPSQVYSVDITGCVDDPSQEFVLETYYVFNFDGNLQSRANLQSLTIVERGEFGGKGVPLVPHEDSGGGGIFGWIGEIFILIGRLIIAGFATVGIDIIAAIGNIQTWLTTVQTAITGAIGNIQGWLNTVGAAITSAIGDIQTWLGTLQTAITDAIGNIQSWINGVWAAFSAAAGTFIDACITALGTLISEFVGWAIDCVFWLWDQLSLPDLLAIIDTLLTGFIQLATNLPATILQFISALQAVWMLVIYLGVIFFFLIPCLSAPSVGEWIEKVIQAMGFDITLGLQVLGTGMRIPAVLPWGVCIIYYVLTDVIFGGFF